MLLETKFTAIERNWLDTIVCPSTALIVAANAIALFRDFVNALFAPEFLSEIGLTLRPSHEYGYNIRSGIREAIVEAGRMRKILRMRYDGKG